MLSLRPDLVLKDVITAINIVIDTEMPLVTLSRKRYRLYKKPWIAKGIPISIYHRDKLYKKYFQNKNEQNFTIYKTHRNNLTHRKELSRQNYYKRLLIDSKRKSSKIWTAIDQLLCKNKLNFFILVFIIVGIIVQ